jgi:hypothetical protein
MPNSTGEQSMEEPPARVMSNASDESGVIGLKLCRVGPLPDGSIIDASEFATDVRRPPPKSTGDDEPYEPKLDASDGQAEVLEKEGNRSVSVSTCKLMLR